MPAFNVSSEAQTEGMNRYFQRMKLAAELDPEAFRASHLASFTDQQAWRQHLAEEQVIRAHPELAPQSR